MKLATRLTFENFLQRMLKGDDSIDSPGENSQKSVSYSTYCINDKRAEFRVFLAGGAAEDDADKSIAAQFSSVSVTVGGLETQVDPAEGGASSEKETGLEILASIDWSVPATAGHLKYASSQMCAYERQMLNKWSEMVEEEEKKLTSAGTAREEDAFVLLRQCENILKDSEVIESRRRQRRREQANALLQTTAKGWKEVLEVIDALSDPTQARILPVQIPPPSHVTAGDSARAGGEAVDGSGDRLPTQSKLRWKLDNCENPMRQRRKLIPFPEFVQHPPRHVWDAAASLKGKDASGASSENENDTATGADGSGVPGSLVKIGKELIKTLTDGEAQAEKSEDITPEELQQQSDTDETEDREEEDEEAGDEKDAKDDDDWVNVDMDATVIFSCNCELVTPGAVVAGTFELTHSWITFTPDVARSQLRKTSRDDSSEISRLCAESRYWETGELTELHARRYLLRDTALECFFTCDSPVFFNFPPPQPVTAEVYKAVMSLKSQRLHKLNVHYLNDAGRVLQRYQIQEDWVQRRISNFEYLMSLNSFAGRSFNDLTQYPVFPWVLKDYSSEHLQLDNPESYR